MKLEKIMPCICVEHLPESGDSSYYGMPQLKVTQIFQGKLWYTHFCPNCGRGGLNQFKTPEQAFRDWNELQERLWAHHDGKPDPVVKRHINTLPENGYDRWRITHHDLQIAPGEHFLFQGEEYRVRSDGNALLVYDRYECDWLCSRYPIEEMVKKRENIEKLPFEQWHVDAGEPDHIWYRYVHERLFPKKEETNESEDGR